MSTEAAGLIQDGDRVVGVRVKSESGEQEVRGGLVVAADGRHSVLRRLPARLVGLGIRPEHVPDLIRRACSATRA